MLPGPASRSHRTRNESDGSALPKARRLLRDLSGSMSASKDLHVGIKPHGP